MYKVRYIKRILSGFGHSTSDISVEKTFELPFPPSKDIKIWDGIDELAQEIYWDHKKQEFRCYLESNKEIYMAVLRKTSHRSLEEIVNYYIEDGWKIIRI